MPRFSIVIPCFNAGQTIGQTLDSLQAQTMPDWEAICVDDGSTDATRDIVRQRAADDPRIRPVCNTGKGPSMARNLGALDQARGSIVAFCDADDLWLPTKLARLATRFADQSVDGVYGQIGFFQVHPDDVTVFSTVPTGDLRIQTLLGENPVCTMSNMAVRRDVFAATGGFDTGMVHNEDLEWLIRLVGSGARVVGMAELQTLYRTSVGGLSTDLGKMVAGRARAVQTAARFGVAPSPANHAVHHRYLARRALRLGSDRTLALRHAIQGLAHSPAGFFTPFRRGALTLAGACGALALPRATRQSLFT